MRRSVGLLVVIVAFAIAVSCGPQPADPVTSTEVTVDGQTVVVSVPGTVGLTVVTVDPAAVPPAPDGLDLPVGALAIQVSGIPAGSSTQVTISLPTRVNVVRKLIAGAWSPFGPDGTTGAWISPDGRRITVTLRDGGRGDADGVANGVIDDPIAPAVATPIEVAASVHTCALLSSGTIRCWGPGDNGRLGDGQPIPPPGELPTSPTPTDVVDIEGASAVSAGTVTCALISGSVSCWGPNDYGVLGDGTRNPSSAPVSVLGITDATAIAVGGGHACAIVGGGAVKCWGGNYYAQLGDALIYDPVTGVNVDSPTPVTVAGISGATAIAAGADHTCVVLGDGSVRCWGRDRYGQLGDGGPFTFQNPTPVEATGVDDAVAISADATGDHTCVLRSTGTLSCWGFNYFGQLGDGNAVDPGSNVDPVAIEPVDVVGINGATAVAVGGWHTCALVGGGDVECWGLNDSGQLGSGTWAPPPGDFSTAPVAVTGVSGATSLTSGERTGCAVLASGTVKCWGSNQFGQLGDGTVGGPDGGGRATAVEVVGL